ncbi:type II toxin-antitoxin system prevent-host-death family antitoxin [Candidatus Nomurabacteria bacterium]|jgi:antitoxin (DNA-binding transcriptional repressor) of toxin-antitoxin stability system|nr:type II toxin-antitoxin system prevent-host-death family antitoxin [Candidatus Nomurabacteria bacterium]
MSKVYAIHEAKTQLSKLVKKAEEGQTVYLGAYGRPTAILTKLPEAPKIKIGIYADKYKDVKWDDSLISSDEDIVKDFEDSLNRDDCLL